MEAGGEALKVNKSNKDKNISDCFGNHMTVAVKSVFCFKKLFCLFTLKKNILKSSNKLLCKKRKRKKIGHGRMCDMFSELICLYFCQGITHVVCHLLVNLNPYV